MFLLFAAGVAAVVVAFVVWAGRRAGALVRVAFTAVVIVGATWLGGLALMSRGWKDTDGWIDCNDYCHGWHYFGAFLFWIPPVAGLMLLVILVIAAVGRRRGARAEDATGGTR